MSARLAAWPVLKKLVAAFGLALALLGALPAAAQTFPVTPAPVSSGQAGNVSGALFGQTPPSLPDPGGFFSGLQGQAQAIETTVTVAANRLFFGLVALDIAWTLVGALLGRGELGEMLISLTQKVVTFNLVYWVFVVNGANIVRTIVSSFYSVGQSSLNSLSPGAPTDPVAIFLVGAAAATPMVLQATALGFVPDEVLGTGFTNLGQGLIQSNVIGATLTIGSFAFLAGTLALALVEAYIVTAAGVLMTGFLGSRWTVSLGEKYFSYAVSVGVKLMMLYIVLGLVAPLAGWIAGFSFIPVVGPILAGGVAAVVAMLAYGAPQFAASLINGSSNSSFGQFAGMLAGVAAGAAKAGASALGLAGTANNLRTAGAAGGAGRANATRAISSGETSTPSVPPVKPDLNTSPGVTPGDVFEKTSTTAETNGSNPLSSFGDIGGNANLTGNIGGNVNAPLAAPESNVLASRDAIAETSDSPASSQATEGIADPYAVKRGAYKEMDAASLGRNVNVRTIPQMSRAQLQEIRSNSNYASLRPDQRADVAAALAQKQLKGPLTALETFGSLAEGVAKALPSAEHGSTGAVSIRVNV
jgi:type IV secretion system protein TrbL